MSTKHEMLCGQRTWNDNNKINKMINVGISIKKNTYLFSIEFKACDSLVVILVMVLQKLYHFTFKFFSKRTFSIYFFQLFFANSILS